MVNIELKIPENWFCAEVRDNHFISREKKEIWAIQLDMLYQVQRICEKYNIRWFADGGTLLGAIRHGGFIPWDDDIDIAMLPEDYDKFNKVAMRELKYPYFLQTDWTDDVYYCHTKLRRTDTTAILSKDASAKFEFNQGIFIDIFPMDFVPTNDEMSYRRFVDQLWMMKNEMLISRSRWWLYERSNHECYKHANDLRSQFEQLRRKYFGKGTTTVANLSLPSLSNDIRKELSEYSDTIYMRFEMLKIPVPSGWHEILTRQYGEYMKPKKGSSKHGDILFDAGVSFLDSPILGLQIEPKYDKPDDMD